MTDFLHGPHSYRFETLQLHVGQEEADPATDARAAPIYQTTSYVFRNCEHAAARFGLADAGNIYGRLTNTTQDVLERRMAALEGGAAALAVASGAAAIAYTFENLAEQGDHIVSAKTIYGGTCNFLAHTFPARGGPPLWTRMIPRILKRRSGPTLSAFPSAPSISTTFYTIWSRPSGRRNSPAIRQKKNRKKSCPAGQRD